MPEEYVTGQSKAAFSPVSNAAPTTGSVVKGNTNFQTVVASPINVPQRFSFLSSVLAPINMIVGWAVNIGVITSIGAQGNTGGSTPGGGAPVWPSSGWRWPRGGN